MTDELNLTEIDVQKTLREIGNQIKAARKVSRRQIESISKKTKIRASYLIGIEEGEFEGFTDFIYKKGFIKTYAKFFDLDFSRELDLITRVEEDNNKNKYIEHEDTKSALPSAKYFVIAFISLVSIITGWIQYKESINEENFTIEEDIKLTKEKIEDVNESENINYSDDYSQKVFLGKKIINSKYDDESNLNVLEEVKDEEEIIQPALLFDNNNKNIKITFFDETWIQIYTKDDLIVKSGVYKKGEVIELEINENNNDYIIDTGNAGGFKLQFQNKDLPVLGDLGSVKKNISLLDYYEKLNIIE